MTISQESNEDRLDRIERILAETAAAQKQGQEQLAEIRVLVQANTAAIADLGQRVDQLTGQQQRNNQDLSVIKGWQTELNVKRNAGNVFARLSNNGDLFRIYPRIDLSHYVGFGTRAGFISRDDAEKVRALDFLLEGTDGSGAPIMYAVEVSYTAGYEDIDRALERAPIAARMLGRQVIPAVAAEVISMDFEERAQRKGVRWTYVPNGNRIMQ